MKKYIYIILIIFTIFFQNIAFSQKKSEKTNNINVDVVHNNYYDSFIKKISFLKRKLFVFLKKDSKIDVKKIDIINRKIDYKNFSEKSFYSRKLKYKSNFPFKSYLLFLDKKKSSKKIDDVIPINGKKIRIVKKGKKIKVTLIFKSFSDIKPKDDIESYAKVYLDKKFIGLTEQKLLSQSKTISFYTTYERHLLKLVIYIQDPSRKRWRRLRNINQPEPKYFLPQDEKNKLFLQIIYYPYNRIEKYKFEGSFYKN